MSAAFDPEAPIGVALEDAAAAGELVRVELNENGLRWLLSMPPEELVRLLNEEVKRDG